MRDLFRAASYLHNRQIAHRDISPKNLLLLTKDPMAGEVKLSDFGLAEKCTTDSLTERIGTRDYVAPEVIKGVYDHRCDNWSLGVVLYELLAGNRPFKGADKKELFQSIITGDYTITGPEFYSVSDQA